MQIAIGVGGNLGNKVVNILNSISLMHSLLGIKLVKSSQFYVSKALTKNGNSDDPVFINAAILADTHLSPEKLLFGLKYIESRIGRVQSSTIWAPRVIDLDILLFGDLELNLPGFLTIPHAEMHLRDFVLEPMCDICPEAFHPGLSKTLHALKNELKVRYVTDKFLFK